MPKKEKLLLLDANAIIHRSFHALPPLTSPKGEQVNAVYGFAATLLKAIEDERPDYIAACYDVGKETFRTKLYPEYKAHRKETDQSLYSQIPRTENILEALSIPRYAQQGVEADDLIGSLSSEAVKQGLEVVIATGDNDALQLVNESISVYSLRRGVTDVLTYRPKQVIEKLGVKPEQVVDYKALSGDSSDNIPGAPGVGPKTASELLSRYGSLDEIYHRIDELPNRLGTILTQNKNLVYLSQQLGAIRKDLTVKLDLSEADVKNFDFRRVVTLFQELGFRSLQSKLPKSQLLEQSPLFGNERQDKIVPQLPYEAITDLKRWREVVSILKKQAYLAVDTETVDLEGELIGIAFAWSKDEAVYLPLAPRYPGGLEIATVEGEISKILQDPNIRKIGHNIKFDLHVLDRAGFSVSNVWFDTMIASGLVLSSLFSHSLDDVSLTLLNFKKITTLELLGNKKHAKMTDVALDDLAAYACEDVLITYRLFQHFQKDLEVPDLKRIFFEIEMPLLPVLFAMEKKGVMIDRAYLELLAIKLKKRTEEIEAQAQKVIGRVVNLSSPVQLKQLLFNELKLSAVGVKRTKTGYSTDAETLLRLKQAHPIVPLILEYRELSKLLSTYVETLPKLADSDGRVHTSFMQLGAATGRLSSNNPNLQNIPIRTELGNEVRRAFVARPGCVLLSADYSQIELRLVAHLSQDPDLIEAFRDGEDFHSTVARQLGVDRRTAKAINFGIIYGLGPQGLSNDLGIAVQEARLYIERYFTRFPGVARFIEGMKQQAKDQGYVATMFGRRRFLPDIHSPNPMLRFAAERMAVNMPAQGSVADMVKKAMVLMCDKPLGGDLLIQIHDELLFEVEKARVQIWAEYVKKKMTQVVELAVPLVVDVEIGDNWADLKKTT